MYTCGIFESLELARKAVQELLEEQPDTFLQINKIPLNTIGNYGESFDMVESVNDPYPPTTNI